MEKNNIIIILLLVIIALMVGLCLSVLPTMMKEDCNLSMTSSDTLDGGENIAVKLTDKNGNPIANETINVYLNNNNKTNQYTATTNSKGIATVPLSGVSPNKYEVVCEFNGNEKFHSSSISKNITVKETTTEAVSQDSSSTSSSDSTDSIEANRPRNDPNYKGYTPRHESEVTSDGWNPAEHETYRENNPDGGQTIHYDDGYTVVTDENGYIITYGFR